MSKISVFKFKLNGQNSEMATAAINNYLNLKGFSYVQDTNSYETGKISPEEQAKDVAISTGLSVAATALTAGVRVANINSVQKGFEYSIDGDTLTIKAYIISGKDRIKTVIHTPFKSSQQGNSYMTDLNNNLFKILEGYNITKDSTTEEYINDGSEKSIGLKLAIIFFIMIAVSIGIIIVVLG